MAPRRSRRSNRPLVVVFALLAAGLLVWWLIHPRAGGMEVYFVHFDAVRHKGSLVAVRRPAPRGPIEGRLRAALHALLAGPRVGGEGAAQDLATEIPPGTTLLGVQVNGRIVTVNLSKTYAAGGGSTSMLARVWQVVYTATQFPEAPEVQVLVDGRRVEGLGGEGVVIGAPLRRPLVPPSF